VNAPPAGPPPGRPPPPQGPVGGYGIGLPPGVSPDAVETGAAMPSGGRQDQLAVVSVVFGALSIFTAWCCIGGLFGIVGLTLGLVALGRSKEQGGQNRSLAIAGVATSAAGLGILILFQLLPFGIGLFSSLRGP
jgi:hypothetical protein